jgi:D-tyrosyl-tRNA(Tyr) deacylase
VETEFRGQDAWMRAVVQRVTRASVDAAVDGVDGVDGVDAGDARRFETVGQIGRGLCVLVGVTHDDDVDVAAKVADKIWNLRVFDDDAGVMNRSAADVGAEILVVSQFTLYGDTSAGRRPSWLAAARPEHAEPLVDHVTATLRALGATVATGRFRAEMRVSLVNDGPVTVLIER